MKENKSLYFFEGIACLLVIFIHLNAEGLSAAYINQIADCAVPFFFMLGGFSLFPYLGTENFSKKLKKRLVKNLILAALAMMIYVSYDLTVHLAEGKTLAEIIRGYFSAERIRCFFLYNDVELTRFDTSPYHLWYLFALMYGYAILLLFSRLLKKENVRKIGICAAAFVVLKNIFAYVVALLSDGGAINAVADFLTSAEWINGTCYILIGLSLSAFLNEEKTEEKISEFRYYKPVIIIAIFAIAAIRLLVIKLTANYAASEFRSSLCIILGSALPFLYSKRDNMKETNLMVWLGKYLSRDIYLWHMLVLIIVYTGLSHTSISGTLAYAWLFPVATYALTLILCLLLNVNKIKRPTPTRQA